MRCQSCNVFIRQQVVPKRVSSFAFCHSGVFTNEFQTIDKSLLDRQPVAKACAVKLVDDPAITMEPSRRHLGTLNW